MTYKELAAFLDAPRARDHDDRPIVPRSHNRNDGSPIDTRCQRRAGGDIAIRLVDTDILVFRPDGSITLNSGGFRGYLTKERINRFLPRGWTVYQERGTWFLCDHLDNYMWTDAPTWVFEEGMTIHPDRTVTGAADLATVKANEALAKRINKYANDYVKALIAGKIGLPDLGDCMICRCRTTDGDRAFAETREHLESHMAEKYYVPSLIYNAIGEFAVGPLIHDSIYYFMTKSNESAWLADVSKSELRSSLRRYLRRHCGLAS